MVWIKKIVRNDAIKHDPAEIYNWRVFALAAAACFGGTLLYALSPFPTPTRNC